MQSAIDIGAAGKSRLPAFEAPFALTVAIVLSWMLTVAVYWNWTQNGNIFSKSIKSATVQSFGGSTVVKILGEKEYFFKEWKVKDQLLILRLVLSKNLAAKVFAGKLASVQSAVYGDANMKPRNCGATSLDHELALAIGWEFDVNVTRPRLDKLYGKEARKGCVVVGGYTKGATLLLGDAAWLLPFARDVVINVPEGALRPVLKRLITSAEIGLNKKSDLIVTQALTERLSFEVRDALGLQEFVSTANQVAFWGGPVQFVSLFLAILASVLTVFSLVRGWARNAASECLSLIPYVGFFGTLLGMGAALLILGNTNLSDPISKSINLGPIGSKLSLAIETTKFALVCFGLGSLLLLLRDAIWDRSASNL